ncbi:RNA-binding protein 45 [Lycorma delicatula]|uniref:RNA-binding protein 45 n=1 Tax=Lycorma delicatula TaxID=130591 RepID=UPI003F513600
MRSGDYDFRSKADDPPNSRLFIICSKSLTEEDFKNAFDKFGTIEEVWIVRERQTGDPKGVAYIKYAKTSEAALAMESMNGECIADNTRPLKVMIASSKDQGSKREDNEDRLLRLFIVVPKTMTDEDVRDYFKKFGELDYVNVVKDRETKESKGIAYVKYHRMSHAAKAYEECDRSFKAVFARPKESPQDRHNYMPPVTSLQSLSNFSDRNSMFPSGSGDIINGFPNPDGYTRLCVLVVPSLNLDMVSQLFNIIPGMEACRFTSDGRTYNSRKVLVQYNTPQAAAYAREKLHGFEYPPGHRISVKPDMDYGPTSYSGYKSDLYSNVTNIGNDFRPGFKNDMLSDMSSSAVGPNGIAALTKALAEATQVIQKAGLLPNSANFSRELDISDPTYCSAKLPPPQPLSPADAKCAERLFIVCLPTSPPIHALWDVFGRFGNLIEVYLLSGKNCGYVSYANKESADKAVEVLHGQEICRSRVKVMLAEPKKGDGGRKRLRTDLDN